MSILGVGAVGLIVAVLAIMGVGSLWYSPFMFGSLWMKLKGNQAEHEKTEQSKAIGIFLIGAVLMSLVLGVLLHSMEAKTVLEALMLAFFMWLGLIVPVLLNDVAFGGRSLALFCLDAAHLLVSVGLASIVLTILK